MMNCEVSVSPTGPVLPSTDVSAAKRHCRGPREVVGRCLVTALITAQELATDTTASGRALPPLAPPGMDRYHELTQLGKGSYGTVFLVRERSRNKTWCMKKIALKGLGPRERQAAFLEVKLLRELRHPHVVSFHDSFVHRPSNLLCLVMTFCQGGDLHKKVQERKKNGSVFSEGRVVVWLLQVTLALQYIHERHNIIHRDLKTQNIFLMEDGTTLKLGDFGVSRVVRAISRITHLPPRQTRPLPDPHGRARRGSSTSRPTSLVPASALHSTCAPS